LFSKKKKSQPCAGVDKLVTSATTTPPNQQSLHKVVEDSGNNEGILGLVSKYAMEVSLLSLVVAAFSAYHTKEKAATKHKEHYAMQVEAHLGKNYLFINNRVDDIPGLEYVERDKDKIKLLERIMKSPGTLTLLQGPSGCGKTTVIQHTLAKLERPCVYFSVRDNISALPPLAVFAQAFGINDLPQDMTRNALDIIRMTLEKLDNEKKPPPVLVIDDVEQLLKPPNEDSGGRKIMEWCLGRAAMQQLTILFVSSSDVAHDQIKDISGYGARLSTLHTLFDCINPKDLKQWLLCAQGMDRSFTPEEVDRMIAAVGTHMSDIRGVQRRRVERSLSVDQALSELIIEESRTLKDIFIRKFAVAADMKSADAESMVLQQAVCQQVAKSLKPISLEELVKLVKNDPSCKLLTPVTGLRIYQAVMELEESNILRRSSVAGGNSDNVAFRTPAKRTAYKELMTDREFEKQYQELLWLNPLQSWLRWFLATVGF
jgi:energy-coupling factor transporter ATP-binding protein EcfA2